MRKATNRKINLQFLQNRVERTIKAGFTKQKWIEFCEILLAEGYNLTLYEARQTCSKYITVKKGSKHFKVRFSNHKPSYHKEVIGLCDFFVGRTNLQTTTTADALIAVRKFFQPIPIGIMYE